MIATQGVATEAQGRARPWAQVPVPVEPVVVQLGSVMMFHVVSSVVAPGGAVLTRLVWAEMRVARVCLPWSQVLAQG